MPRVKIDYVVSFSNEDPENQASNLLSWEVSKKKWLCSQGEPSCSVVLQLARAVKISSVQIGAYHAALVEVLVGRSEAPNEPFQVLVPRSVFLSPGESRAPPGPGPGPGTGTVAKVRSFSGAALPAAAAQRWDRLRLVCSQPYNKHCKYGISFIHIFEPDGEPGSAPAPAPAPTPAAAPAPTLSLDTFSSDEEEFHPGELFAKYRQSASGGDTGAQIRQATSQALKNNPEAATKLMKTSLSKDAKQQAGPSMDPRSRDQLRASPSGDPRSRDQQRNNRKLMYTEDDDRPHAKIDHVVQRHKDEKSKEANTPKPKKKLQETDKVDKTPKTEEPSTSRSSVTKRDRDKDSGRERDDGRGHAHRNGESSSHRKGDYRKRPHSERDRAETDGAGRPARESASERPLDGVVLVLSGYQNPRRARLRDLAAALGAAYRREWGPSCTHLICAFSNTPKLLEVRSSANGASVPIPTAEWILECGRVRRKLPWQWFAVESARRVARPEPEPEPEPAPAGGDTSPAHSRRLSECDTDDDIEEVVRQQKRARTSPSPLSTPRTRGAGAGGGAECEDSDEVEFVKDERIQGNITVEDSDSGAETEVERRSPPARASPRGGLPPLFAGLAFLPAAAPDARLLARYCAAYGGLLLQPSEVEEDSECIVLCGSERGSGAGEVVDLPRGRARRLRVRVRAAWLWRCHAAQALLPVDEYLLDDC